MSDKPKTSTRDRDLLRANLEGWMQSKFGASARLSEFSAPTSNGMSSETLLCTVSNGGQSESLVVRLAPDADAVPVFPKYDLAMQFAVMKLVGEQSSVPVPGMRWYEADESQLGAAFLVMDRVDGIVPPDMMPYPFGSWVTQASEAERDTMQRNTVKVLTDLHSIPLSNATDFLHYPTPGDTPLRRHVADQRAYYDWVVAQGPRSPLIERAFQWLDDHWPDEPDPAISWGDSRIGNIMYRDFAPVAVLDWEMAGIAPREVDIGWLAYMHEFFQSHAGRAGVPGLPDFLQADDIANTYRELSGYEPREVEWYQAYAALRYAIIAFRIHQRSAHFGEAQMPANPDDAVMNRDTLERYIGA